nr:hypothetical protein CFP56_59409 [Quercus suber]
MDCVDLGRDFYLIKFNDVTDYDKVLYRGPRFIREHFLVIKPWEPYFKASEATFSAIAVWVIWHRNKALAIGRDDCIDTISTNGNNGVIRGGACNSMETHLPHHPFQRSHRESPIGSSGMGKGSKSLVEIPHKHAIDFREGSIGVKQAKGAIGEHAHVEIVPNSQASQEMRLTPVPQRRNSGDPELYGDVETRFGSIQGHAEEVGMEYDCISQDGD